MLFYGFVLLRLKVLCRGRFCGEGRFWIRERVEGGQILISGRYWRANRKRPLRPLNEMCNRFLIFR